MTITHSRSDQYHRMTALLSACDADIACRILIAAFLFLMGGLPAAMLFTPLGVHGVRGTVLTVAVAVIAVMMMLMWARPSWPTRTQSVALLLAAVGCTMVGALLVPDPIVALLASTFFAALTVYAAFFHAPRYAVLTVAAALGTACVTVNRLAATDGLIAAIGAAVFVLAVALATPIVCWTALRLFGLDSRGGDVDSSTGLLTPAAFTRAVAELLGARIRHDDRRLVLTVVVLDDLPLLTATDGSEGRQRAQVAIADTLRSTTRTHAVLARLDDHVFAVAEIFPSTGLDAYATRIQHALTTIVPRMQISLGIVQTPLAGVAHCPPEEITAALVDLALVQAGCHVADAFRLPITTYPMPGSDDDGCLGR